MFRSRKWGSRNGVAVRFGINEPRLRQNEENGLLPEWGSVSPHAYYSMVKVWQALRNAGWTNVEVRRAFEAIRGVGASVAETV